MAPAVRNDSGTLMADLQFATGGAHISDDGVYRYSLRRTWDRRLGSCLFIMLNPSTADANRDDPTIRKCIRYAKAWGFGQLLVGNLFAFRATDKSAMLCQVSPVGPQNDETLVALASEAAVTIAAWGTDGGHLRRDQEVLRLLRPLTAIQCLGANQNGTPPHPLFQAEGLRYRPFGNTG